MPSTAINFGRLLILIGIIGYGYGLMNPPASLTALIPAVFGIIIMALGHFAKAKDDLRKHLMHAAVLVALLGFIASLVGLFMRFNGTISAGIVSQIAMALVCFAFVGLSIKSFIDARKNG